MRKDPPSDDVCLAAFLNIDPAAVLTPVYLAELRRDFRRFPDPEWDVQVLATGLATIAARHPNLRATFIGTAQLRADFDPAPHIARVLRQRAGDA